jgi:putative two-component system response regulator
MALILIVEDNENIADNLSYFIKYLAHYKTLIANSGELALSTLTKGVIPDIILLDIILPGMDGVDFLLRMRREPMLRGIKVIIYTGTSVSKVRKALEQYNLYVEDVIQKPVRPVELIARIEEAVLNK